MNQGRGQGGRVCSGYLRSPCLAVPPDRSISVLWAMDRVLHLPYPASRFALPDRALPLPRLRSPLLQTTAKSRDSASDGIPGDFCPMGEKKEVESLVPVKKEEGFIAHANPCFQALSKDMAMGLILRAASGTGWTTDSGLEGPSHSPYSASEENDAQPWLGLTKSPRRRMRVAFTCNVCGERTTRAINPHAYTDGTVFVQCGGCNVFHKLVDNLKLFHELKGSVFPPATVSYGYQGFADHQSYDFLGLDDFPVL